jgi:hypothetical protein
MIIRFGIDLAKSSFAVCGVDENEHIMLRKTLNRKQLLLILHQSAAGGCGYGGRLRCSPLGA